jgi:hypothetical protein
MFWIAKRKWDFASTNLPWQLFTSDYVLGTCVSISKNLWTMVSAEVTALFGKRSFDFVLFFFSGMLLGISRQNFCKGGRYGPSIKANFYKVL